MSEIGIIIFCLIEVNNFCLCRIWDSSGRFAPLVPVDKGILAPCLVGNNEPVHLSFGDVEGNSGPVLVAIFIHQFFYYFVFLLFIH